MAIWDKFLTEQDKQYLELMEAKKEPFGFGEHPALLIVDEYYGGLGDKSLPLLESVKTWPTGTGQEGWQAVYRTRELLHVARANGIPVVYCANIAGFPSEWPRGAKPRREKKRQLIPKEWRHREFEIVKEVAPQPGELVVRKASASAFFDTPLLGHLIHLGVDTVIACGGSTSGCLRAAVVDGCSYRLRMGVVEECAYDRHQASHAINLFDMNQKYADVIKLADAISYFEKIGKLVKPYNKGKE